jgi:nitrous oxide reductase accessory protein NosL
VAAMTPSRRDAMTLAVLSLGAGLAGCSRRAGQRCAHCGMIVTDASRWRAGATAAGGEHLVFDTPGCLHRYRLGPRGGGLSSPWVVEYYGDADARTDARRVRFIPGSRVRGPMGPDLVPVEPSKVAEFVRDHGGRAPLRWEDVTRATLEGLD